MSQSKESKKVVVNPSSNINLKATTSSQIESTSTTGGFLFGRKNFTIMLIGFSTYWIRYVTYVRREYAKP